MSNNSIVRGCVVRMSASSGLTGYGNEQCVSSVCEELGTLGLFGHNQHYKISDVIEVVERPEIEDLKTMVRAAITDLRSSNAPGADRMAELLEAAMESDNG